MCWAHVDRAYKPKLSQIDPDCRLKIESDITELQKSSSDEIFDKGVSLFYVKWSKKSPEIDKFLHYFRKEWLDSSNRK